VRVTSLLVVRGARVLARHATAARQQCGQTLNFVAVMILPLRVPVTVTAVPYLSMVALPISNLVIEV
jgi:hypothetical protein